MESAATAGLLGRQLKQMQTDKDIPGISCGLVDDNIMEWEVMLMINDDCRFYGGQYTAHESTRNVDRAHIPFKEASFAHTSNSLQNTHTYRRR